MKNNFFSRVFRKSQKESAEKSRNKYSFFMILFSVFVALVLWF